MIWLVGRRLLFGTLILVVIIFFTHLGLGMSRGQRLAEALGPATGSTVDTITNTLRGDLGLSEAATSTLNPLPVREVFPTMLKNSLGLLAVALLIAVMIGLPLGLFTAQRKRSTWSTSALVVSIIGISIPSFFAAFLLQRLVIEITQTTGQRLLPVGGFGWDAHIILPALVLAARPIAQITRVTSGTVRDIHDQEYVRTAHSKGLSPQWVTNRHVLRNAAIPIATTIVLSIRFMLISLPVVEAFFGWPGLGYYLLRSIPIQDDNLTVILVMCLGAIFIFINLVLDVSYRGLDPRLRSKNGGIIAHQASDLRSSLRDLWDGLVDFITLKAIRQRIEQMRNPAGDSPFQAILANRENNGEVSPDPQPLRRRSWWKVIFSNPALIFGTAFVIVLLGVALFGHLFSPLNPYTTQGLKIVEGEFLIPPFEPDDQYFWGTDVIGRDILSMILTGAWQTLRLAAIVVFARIAVGFLLGSLAGWNSGRTFDRILQGAVEVISAFPALLLAMIIILALGIREGFMPFVIALCFVGWGEVMQYVRGEVMAMKSNTYIESAVAVGRRTPGIIKSHVLPNLTPAMISILALEMGAVLMLLGELGFVGVFIGGGAFAELVVDAAPYHYSDVPEWGALLSNVRLYAITYPWSAFYPAMAFFVAIMAFNLFGEGIRKLVTEEGLRIRRIFNRYTLGAMVIVFAGLTWWRGTNGAISSYQRMVHKFNGENAFQSVQMLSSPAAEGRSIGTVGMVTAAHWIADEFEALGLQPAGKHQTYFQPRNRDFEGLDAFPVLAIGDDGLPPVYQQDYVEFPSYYSNLGQAVGPVRFLGMGEMTVARYRRTPMVLEDSDFSGEILMVPSGLVSYYLSDVPHDAVLVVSEDPTALERSYTLSPLSGVYQTYGTGREVGQDTPTLWISEQVADRILGGEVTYADLRQQTEELENDEILEVPTATTVAMDVQGTVYEKVTANHVIGHWPGTAGLPGHQLDDKMIVVLAKYDSPPLRPDGSYLPTVNDNASGVAVMLEAIRAMKAAGYQPYKTLLFVAYSGEGTEGGTPVPEPEIAKLLQAKAGFSNKFEIEAIIDIRGVGAGEGNGLILGTGGSMRLAGLFEDAARRMGVPVKRSNQDIDISMIYRTGSARDSGEEGSKIRISWQGWEETAQTMDDTIDQISAEKLEDVGKTLVLALMTIGRETRY